MDYAIKKPSLNSGRLFDVRAKESAVKPINKILKIKADGSIKIVALGDSLTYGWMVVKGYLDFLEEMLNAKYPRTVFEIVNRGIPGDTAAGGLHRLNDHVLSLNPDLVFIQFALNDAFSGYPLAEFQNNILQIIDKIADETSSEILLMTSSALEERERLIAEKYYGSLQSIAERKNVPIALVHDYWRKKISEGTPFNRLVQADSVHPTAEGYRLMAEAIMEVL